MNCVTGMSILFRKDILADGGGLQSVSQFLAEDFHLGQKCLERYNSYKRLYFWEVVEEEIFIVAVQIVNINVCANLGTS